MKYAYVAVFILIAFQAQGTSADMGANSSVSAAGDESYAVLTPGTKQDFKSDEMNEIERRLGSGSEPEPEPEPAPAPAPAPSPPSGTPSAASLASQSFSGPAAAAAMACAAVAVQCS